MLEQLFGSKTRLKLLRTFFRQPGKLFYVRELARMLGAQINAVRRELALLVKSGLIKGGEKEGSAIETEPGVTLRRYYLLDTDSPLYPELEALLYKDQAIGQQEFLQAIKEKGGQLKLFLVTGRFVGDKRAPTDLLLVGSIKARVVARIIARHEREFGFEIRYTIMTEKEFFERRQIMDKFLYALFEAENVKVVNKLNI